MLRFIGHSFKNPAQNLALDEVLLNGVNDGHTEATLRIWESPIPFVVLGTAQVAHDVANGANCEADGVPILRRCTAGGCVLQGIGSLNFSLALDFRSYPHLKNLHDSYCWILKQLSAALEPLGIATKHEGICDLALNGKKISGNAQRRRRNALLHHGTLLYRIDPVAMARYLPEPADRPDYRGARGHDAFVTTLPLEKDVLTQAITAAFSAAKSPLPPTPWEMHETRTLAREKYENPEWNFRR